MVKGLLGKKEKVAQAVDKSPACVDKCLFYKRASAIKPNGLPLQRLRFTSILGVLRYESAKEVRKLSLAYCALRRWLGKEKERVLSYAANFLSIYWLRV